MKAVILNPPEPVARKRKRRLSGRLGFVLRVAVTLAVGGGLVLAVDPQRMPGVSEARWSFATLTLVFVLFDRLANAFRWSLLTRGLGLAVPTAEVVGIYLKSNFVGLVMPSSLGGEILKGYALSRSTSRVAGSVVSLIAERLVGVSALAVVCLLASFYPVPQTDEGLRVAFLGARLTAGAILAAVALAAWAGREGAFRKAARLGARFEHVAKALQRAVHAYRGVGRVWAPVIACSFTIQILRIAATWSAARTVALDLPIHLFAVFVPVVSLVAMLPVSLSGLGVQEGAFVYFFALAGAEPSSALAMGLWLRAALLLSVVPGGALYLAHGLVRNRDA